MIISVRALTRWEEQEAAAAMPTGGEASSDVLERWENGSEVPSWPQPVSCARAERHQWCRAAVWAFARGRRRSSSRSYVGFLLIFQS